MPILPTFIMPFLVPFRPLFQQRTWDKAQVLVVGAILAVGKRTVTSALRVMGLSQERQFAKYHQVLNRAVWSAHQAARVLLQLLIEQLAPDGDAPLVFGIDETIERRWGAQIAARGIYRDAVRSSKSFFVKCSGLRWVSLMWLHEIPWAHRVWALPFLTVLAPSERFYQESGRAHKKITDWARQMILQLRRWLPDRALVVVADYSYATLEVLHACQRLAQPVTMITRLRLDAALYEPAPPYSGRGRPRKKGARLPTLQQVLADVRTGWQPVELPWYDGQVRRMELASATAVWYHAGLPPVPLRWVLVRDPAGPYEPVALLSTDQTWSALQIASWFVQRWQVEVTFEEARAHLGVESQRQWSDQAIARTTPLLLGLFSWVTLLADYLFEHRQVTVRQAAWYAKTTPTFSDAIGWVRQALWRCPTLFPMSPSEREMVKVPRPLLDRLWDTLCYAA